MFLRVTNHNGEPALLNFKYVKRVNISSTIEGGSTLTIEAENGAEKIAHIAEPFERVSQLLGIPVPGEMTQLRAVGE